MIASDGITLPPPQRGGRSVNSALHHRFESYRRTSGCHSALFWAKPTGGLDGALDTGTSLGMRGAGMSSGVGSPGEGAGAGLTSGFFEEPGVIALTALLSHVPWVTCGLRPPD